ncbi:MAG: hypothetical protein AAGG48_31870 [Planctomycetota bacterium]
MVSQHLLVGAETLLVGAEELLVGAEVLLIGAELADGWRSDERARKNPLRLATLRSGSSLILW